MSRLQATEVVYFGKLPARGDFVRNGDAHGLTQRLDEWLSQGIERLARDPRWKETYDQAAHASFAFLGVRSRAIVAGHLLASSDASGRRFPFVAVGQLEVAAPLAFMQRAPLALAPLWGQLTQATEAAHQASDVVPSLNRLGQLRPEVDIDPQAHEAGFQDFLELQTVGSLQALLGAADPMVDLRRTLLGLGLLLQPVPASGVERLDKGLRLPLPADAQQQALVAALWLDLAARFLIRGDFEVALFLPQPGSGRPPSLAIGFSGDAPALLHALLDPLVAGEQFIDLHAPEWVDDSADHHDYAVRKLGSYLQQPQLSLAQARSTFNEAFLGE
ncbi:type VI secretion system-associated protein TagF [Aquabacterium sp.]|uniref:type VI secretion system-associated protein TagF n=1 Tax=Aquabacterium sp. TaxID=1872578 RepID=UPI003783BD95